MGRLKYSKLGHSKFENQCFRVNTQINTNVFKVIYGRYNKGKYVISGERKGRMPWFQCKGGSEV